MGPRPLGRRLLAGLATLALPLTALTGPGAPPSFAAPTTAFSVTWTPLASTTTADIVAVEYQSASRLWFATAAGALYRRVGSTFQQEYFAPGTVFTDLEFSPDGVNGIAVGTNGTLVRSINGGDTWSAQVLPNGGRSSDENCAAADQPVGDIDSVRFVDNSSVWLVGTGTQILRSTNSGATFAYVNDAGTTCKVPDDVDDVFAVPGSSTAYFVGRSFGEVFQTSDNLASSAAPRPASAGNGFTLVRRMVGDPASPNRQWAVTPSGAGGTYLARTTDAWSTADPWTIINDDTSVLTAMNDVAFAGGRVLSVGDAGTVLDSADGVSFRLTHGPGALATTDWASVSLANASSAVVGGIGGKLALLTFTALRKPSAVRSVAVRGEADALRRKVTWRAPVSNGGASITGYVIIVKKGARVLLRTSVGGGKRSVVVKRSKLRTGSHVVIVRARNSQGLGVAGSRSFAVRN